MTFQTEPSIVAVGARSDKRWCGVVPAMLRAHRWVPRVRNTRALLSFSQDRTAAAHRRTSGWYPAVVADGAGA